MVNTAVRFSGVALVLGALGLGAAIVLVTLKFPERDPSPLESILLLVASILFMLALPAMYARQSEAAGWLGLVGHVLLEVGTVLLIVYAGGPLLNPADKGLGESVTAFLLALALLSGFVLTALATLRAPSIHVGGASCSLARALGSWSVSSWPRICRPSPGR